VNAIELPLSLVDRALPQADPALYRVIERHAEALLAARPAPQDTTSERVQRVLIEALNANSSDVSLTAVAAELRLSERSLQRRLAGEGTSFDALLERLRLDLALRYLGDQSIAIAEVAYLLGYSEPSAFHRAFKRWTGRTPSAVRRATDNRAECERPSTLAAAGRSTP
jgi:AraC-like DNA-binding protein